LYVKKAKKLPGFNIYKVSNKTILICVPSCQSGTTTYIDLGFNPN